MEYIYSCTVCQGQNVQIKQWTYPNQMDKLADNEALELNDCCCEDHTKLEITETEQAS